MRGLIFGSAFTGIGAGVGFTSFLFLVLAFASIYRAGFSLERFKNPARSGSNFGRFGVGLGAPKELFRNHQDLKHAAAGVVLGGLPLNNGASNISG